MVLDFRRLMRKPPTDEQLMDFARGMAEEPREVPAWFDAQVQEVLGKTLRANNGQLTGDMLRRLMGFAFELGREAEHQEWDCDSRAAGSLV